MDVHEIDPLLAEVRERVTRLEHRTTWLEQVSAQLIRLIGQLVKPAKERT